MIIDPRHLVFVWFSLFGFFASAAPPSLGELFHCDMLLEVPDPVASDVVGYSGLRHLPHDGESTPVWDSGSAFERAFLMTTEVVRPHLFPDVTADIIFDLERETRRGRGGPRLRIEFPSGRVAWSPMLIPNRAFERAVGPESVKAYLAEHLPHGWRAVERLSLYFWNPHGRPPSLAQVAEGRGALLIAKRHFGLRPEVELEVHGIGPLPEKPQIYVDFNIDLGKRPAEVRGARARH